MISRTEFLYVKSKLDALRVKLFDFEMQSPIYKKWKEWDSLPYYEKSQIGEEWDRYYKQTAEGSYGQAFFNLKDDFSALSNMHDEIAKKEAVQRLRSKIAEVLGSRKPDIQKPTSADPNALYNDTILQQYFKLKDRLGILEKLYIEYKPVYETKQNDMNL